MRWPANGAMTVESRDKTIGKFYLRMAITDWPEGERPRERLLALGPQALSDAELLAIFLRVGVRGRTAVDLARDLLGRYQGSLGRLGAAPPRELAALPGLGPAKACQLAATLELARRALAEDMHSGDLLASPEAVRMPTGRRPASFSAGLSMPSTSRPIALSLSAIACGVFGGRKAPTQLDDTKPGSVSMSVGVEEVRDGVGDVLAAGEPGHVDRVAGVAVDQLDAVVHRSLGRHACTHAGFLQQVHNRRVHVGDVEIGIRHHDIGL